MVSKRRGQRVDGWIVLDKPAGLSSTAAVARVRRLMNAAKAGHGGTLDPLATGLLPIALGEATKTVPYVMDGMKTYRFTLRFGEARATDDAEGEVIGLSPVRPTDEEIIETKVDIEDGPSWTQTLRMRDRWPSRALADALMRVGEDETYRDAVIGATRLMS